MATEKTIYADCPMCGGRLEINVNTGKVVMHWPKEETSAQQSKEDLFAAALKKQKEAKEKLDSYFKNAPKQMADNKKKLDKHFKDEKKRIFDEKDFSRPENPFDLD